MHKGMGTLKHIPTNKCNFRYVNIDDRFTELRSDKLVAELSNKLGAALGSEVLIPLTYPDGSPRLCNR